MVIAVLGVVATTTFVAIDPARRLQTARNSTRWADVTSLLEAIKKYEFDHDGVLPAIDDDPATVQIIGNRARSCDRLRCAQEKIPEQGCMLMSLAQDLRPYLKKVPEDPKTGSGADTRYAVNKDEYAIVTVTACDAEGEERGGGGTPPVIEMSR